MQTGIILILALTLWLGFAGKLEDMTNITPFYKGLTPLFSTRATNYYLSTFQATAEEARQYCKQSDRRLLSIETDTEQTDIQIELSNHADIECIWTSGSDIHEEGRWTWGNQYQITFNNYIPGLTANCNQHCLKMLVNSDLFYRYKWVKANCDEQYNFVCEEPI